jgi:cytoskeletal protein CcmA (bactofilin family)
MMSMKKSQQPRRNGENNFGAFSTINASTKIKGEISSETDLRIDGTIEGNIECKARVFLGPSAQIVGNIVTQNADIECSVVGDVFVEDQLKLTKTANIKGDIYTKKLIVESGAVFIGRCEMGYKKDVNQLFNDKKPEEIKVLSSEEEKQSA